MVITNDGFKNAGSNQSTFERTLNASCVDLNVLRSISRHGIPMQCRKMCWQLLLGYLPVDVNWRKSHIAEKRKEYFIAVEEQYDPISKAKQSNNFENFRQVILDVPRTKPELGLFSDERVQLCLERILCIWTIGNEDLCYVQGINDLVTPFFAVFLSSYFEGKSMINRENIHDVTESILREVEADTYWCLDLFLSCIRYHYAPDLPGQKRMVSLLEKRMLRVDKDLCNYLKLSGLDFHLFAFKWMNNLLVREFPLCCIIRMWDTYLSEDNLNFEELHVNMCAAFLNEFSPSLKKMEFEDLFRSLQRLPTDGWGDAEVEVLLSQAALWRMMECAEEEIDKVSSQMEIKDDTRTTHINRVIYDTDTLLFF